MRLIHQHKNVGSRVQIRIRVVELVNHRHNQTPRIVP